MAGQLKVNGVTLATEESGTVTLEAPQIKDSSNNVILDQSGTNPVLKNVEVVNNSSMMFRNRIINGDMRIDQRNAGGSVTHTSAEYSVDRWSGVAAQASKFSTQQNAGSVTPPSGFTNYLGVTSLSAYTVLSGERFSIRQYVEGFNASDLGYGTIAAKTITLSFWVRSSLTGTFGAAIAWGSAVANERSYPFTYEISSANTWEYKTVTIPGDTGTAASGFNTTTGRGIALRFGLGENGSTAGTAGSWANQNVDSVTGATSVVGTSGATWYITGVQLEVGTVATPFEHRPYGTELALCQRYYEQGGYSGNNLPLMAIKTNSAANWQSTAINYQVSKRAINPSIIVTDANRLTGTSGSNGVTATSITPAFASDSTSSFHFIDSDTGASSSIVGYFLTAWSAASEL